MPKAQKTPKNPMAKVTKESDLHDEKQSHDDAVDSKSGKALVDLDAKAEKLSKASKAVIVSGKASKKESSKAEKKASSNDSKSGKSGTAQVIPGTKGGKSGNRLFPKSYKVHSPPEDDTESSMSM